MKRISEFEGLRGILALWVVVTHIIPTVNIHSESLGIFKILAQGNQAVDVFIILSGFFIFYLIESHQESYKVYITRRFLRIFPVYFVCLILSILLIHPAIEALQQIPWESSRNLTRIKMFESSLDHFLPHLIAHSTMLHGVIPDSFLLYSSYAFIGQAWSISLEWQFYLVAPLIFLAISQKNSLLTLVVLCFTCLIYVKFRGSAALLFDKVPFFLIGIVSFYLWSSKQKLNEYLSSCQSLLMPICLTIGIYFIKTPSILIWIIVFSSILVTNSSQRSSLETLLCRALSHPTLLYLGKISYSIYLSHMIVLYSTIYIIGKLLITPTQNIYFAILLLVVPSITIAFSHFLYLYIEKPFIKVGKNLFSDA